MDHTICPGSRVMRQPKPEQFDCTTCGAEVEIWSDEISGKCLSCGTIVAREGIMSCVEWCTMARDCVGDDLYDSFQQRKNQTIKDRLLIKAGESDPRLNIDVGELERAMHFAEVLVEPEGAAMHVVLAGTVLRELRKNDANQARDDLLALGFQIGDIDEVCTIVEHTDDVTRDSSPNSRVVHDAHMLARIERETFSSYPAEAAKSIEKLKIRLVTASSSDLLQHVLSA